MAMSLEIVTEHRGISVDTLEEAGVWWKEDDNYNVRVPYRNLHGEWYTRVMLDPRKNAKEWQGPKVLSPKNAEYHLYNPLRLGPNADLVFFCEGEYDTLSVIDCGYPAVGSQGTNTFNPVWARLFGGAINCIAFDGDVAGVNASRTLRKFFKDQGSHAYLVGTSDKYDLNDLHQQGILEDFLQEFLDENEIEYESQG
jgi:DNA primase